MRRIRLPLLLVSALVLALGLLATAPTADAASCTYCHYIVDIPICYATNGGGQGRVCWIQTTCFFSFCFERCRFDVPCDI